MIATAGATALLAATVPMAAKAVTELAPGRGQPFDLGWRFYRGEGVGFEAPAFDDSDWRAVDLPHDWSIEDLPPQPGQVPPHIIGPFDRKAEGGTDTGFTVGGEGWYRKRFRVNVPAAAHAEILFDGAYMTSDVWVNGHHLGNHPNGYTPFAYDITPYLLHGGDNVIAVRVRNIGRNSRWYSGSGIYRHVWLDLLPESARIARFGVCVATRRITQAGAEIDIDTGLESVEAGLTLVSRVKDTGGRTIWTAREKAQAAHRQTVTIASPLLWSPGSPSLYTLETELRRGRVVIDRTTTSFGVRVVEFDATNGIAVNGNPTKMRGGCIHHDHGLLGAAAFDAAEDRKVALLKARGFNAVRPSHNLFSPAFLHACDRHGLMVICETFDCWQQPKLAQDYSLCFHDQWRADLAAIVLSARNHPSVVMWSIGNEIPGRNSALGVETEWDLANEVHRLDPTRPVTAAINEFTGRLVTPSANTARSGRGGVADQAGVIFLDVVGYNYKLRQYESDHRSFPDRVIVGTESFPKDVFTIWDLADRSPYLIGDFVWAAMDYLGEAGIGGSSYAHSARGIGSLGSWPCVVSDCGDLDLIGNQKAASLARDVVWGLSPLELTVQKPPPEGKVELVRFWGWSDERQSWTWPGVEGRTVAVRVYTTGDRVDLHLNGKLLESRRVGPMELKHVEFITQYAPGVLEAVAFRGGKEIARRSLTTVGAPAGIQLIPGQKIAGAGRADISYVAIEVVDGQGRRVPDTIRTIELAVSGAAELIGFGSANPLAVGSFQAASAQSWDGRALAVLRGMGRPGAVTIAARAEGLRGAKDTIRLSHRYFG